MGKMNRKNRLLKNFKNPRIIHSKSTVKKNNEVEVTLKGTKFFESLIFSDQTILCSSRFLELEELIDYFDFEGLISLINKETLIFHYDALSVASVGRLQGLGSTVNRGPLPLGSFYLTSIKLGDWENATEKCLDELIVKTNKNKKLFKKLKYTIIEKAQNFENAQEVLMMNKIYEDFESNSAYIKKLITPKVLEYFGIKNFPNDKLELNFERIQNNDFRCITNLRKIIPSLDIYQEDKIIEKIALTVGSVYRPIFEAEELNALGESNDELRLILESEYSNIGYSLDPSGVTRNLSKVINVCNHLDFNRIDHMSVEKLIKLKDSEEFRAFNKWFSQINEKNEKEIADTLNSINAKALSFLSIPETKKALEFIFFSMQLILNPNVIQSIGFYGLESYLFNMISKKGQVGLFLNHSLPSLVRDSESAFPFPSTEYRV